MKLLSGKLILFLYLSAVGYAVFLGFTAPYHNWDMLGYVGNVLAWDKPDAETLYAQLFADVSATTEGWIVDQFRANPLSASAENMAKQLPFYAVKPLYLGLMWLLHQAGLALSSATWSISAFSFAALAVWLWRWRPRNAPHAVWLAGIVALTWAGEWPMAALARFSTPDSLSILLVIAALWGWLSRRSWPLYFLFALLALLARPDTLVLTGLLAVYFALLAPAPQRMPRLPACFGIALLPIAYAALSHFSGVYSWEIMFTYAFLNKIPDPATLEGTLTIPRYWQVFSASLPLFLDNARLLALLAVSLLAGFCHWMKSSKDSHLWRDLLLLTWAALMIRFTLFPAWGEARYYYAYYLIILRASLELASPYVTVLYRQLLAHREQLRS